MYAIIQSGGKQYRVEPGHTIYVESLDGQVGQQLTLGDVRLVGGEGDLRVGTPSLAEAKVLGTVLEQGRDAKVRVFKYKKRKHYRRTRGHRQAYTALRIDSIQA